MLKHCFVLFASAWLALPAGAAEWKSLFNGKDLSGWEVNGFAGAGEVEVVDGKIQLNMGVALTGIRRTNDLLRTNYEVKVQALKVQGGDFFCGLTFPVKEEHMTLVVGGWGGSLVGISSIDGMDASENEFTQFMRFDDGKWYDIKLRVTDTRVQAWINDERLIDAKIAGRKVSMRPGEIEESAPFGIATYQTTASIREVKIRPVPARIPKVAFIAGKKSHGPGEHEYRKGLQLLSEALEKQVEFIDTRVHFDGWPTDEEHLKDADAIVLFSDGSDQNERNHPLFDPYRRKFLQKQVDRGAGLVALHYTVFVPKEKGAEQFLEWIGGYFDYQSGSGANHWFSKIEARDFTVYPASEHPIVNGVEPFEVKEEFYFNLRFPEDKSNLTPIVTLDPEKKDWSKVVGWAIERSDGGRGFGYTGGHFHKNFENGKVQRLLLNAILWTAKAE